MREDIKINDRIKDFEDQFISILQSVYDPEIELDIYNLGLIYELTLDQNGHCKVVMTFTDAGCSCADTMPDELVRRLKEIDAVKSVQVEIVWSPAWKMTRISRYGRIALRINPK